MELTVYTITLAVAAVITAIVTESGVVHSPDAVSVAEHLSRLNRRS